MSIAVQFEYAHALEALLDGDEHYFTAPLVKYVRRSRLIHGGICGSGNAWKDSQQPFFYRITMYRPQKSQDGHYGLCYNMNISRYTSTKEDRYELPKLYKIFDMLH